MFTNTGLVEHAKMALNQKWGYVWGTFGIKLTSTVLEQKLKQYPDGVGKYEDFIRQNWLDRYVTDCVGLIKSYLWWDGTKAVYNSAQDLSANGMYAAAIVKGAIDTIPDIPGICVWKNGHIGVYIGNGQVIEAHGTKYGVIQTPLKGTGATAWTHWCKCKYITYEEVKQPNWRDILRKVSPEQADDWMKEITEMMVKADKGEVHKIWGYLPLLIEKIGK